MNAALTVEDAVAAALAASPDAGVVLAVSGGRDSMALLHAAARVARHTLCAIATFDHGTGEHARAAVDLARAIAQSLGVPVVAGVNEPGPDNAKAATEAAWREARWQFLRATAMQHGAATVATAHTADDQLETVALRVLRGSSARGLAALRAATPGIVRPLLRVSRADVAAYALAHGIPHLDDPSNVDRRHARARLRAELLPAIERVRPGAAAALHATADRADAWRTATDVWATAYALDVHNGTARVRVGDLADHDAATLAVFWPAFAARAGVRLDRRAVARLVAFTAAACARVRDGTAQPADVPVASTPPGAVVTLRCASDFTSNETQRPRRSWQFAVRAATVRERESAATVAAAVRSDYA